MNKNESKYFGTAILFDEALIYLLEKKDIEYITIKLIDNNSFVLSTSGNDRYYTNSAELNNYINELINTY